MWTRQLLKENGKVAFLRNYRSCLFVSVLSAFLISGDFIINLVYNKVPDFSGKTSEEVVELWKQVPREVKLSIYIALAVAFILLLFYSIFVANVIIVGQNRYFLENRAHKTEMGCLFYGFKGGRYTKVLSLMFVRNLFVSLGMLLFVVPGVILSYSYLLVPYIAAENANLSRKRILKLSKEMMNGHKWEAVELELSFLGWRLLGSFSGGLINLAYTNPYVYATFAEFYTAVKTEAFQKGIVSPDELPGFQMPEFDDIEIPQV